MSIEIRRATSGDAVAVSALNDHVQSLHASAIPWRFKSPAAGDAASSFARDLVADPDAIVLLALLGAQACGYAYAAVNRRGETPLTNAYECVYLHHLSVFPSVRGRGIGSALLAAVRTIAAAYGIARMELDVWTFNEPARTFFSKRGFAVYNERMWSV
jgi:GNAT superfamily N-acetyltransferase